jgi:hypothetical protein
MVGKIVKIVVALLLVHTAYRVGTAYWTFYRYEDAVQQIAQFAERRTDKQVCDEALDTAANTGVPLPASGLTVRRGNHPPYNCEAGPTALPAGTLAQPSGQLMIEGGYVERLQLLPGYVYPWEFKLAVKVWLRTY